MPISARLVAAVLAACTVAAASAEVVWEKSFAAAVKKSAGKKPIFVDFYADWCGPCKMLEREVFPNSRVQALLQRVVCVRIDVDQNAADSKRFKVASIPRLMLLSPDAKRIEWDAVGYRDPDTLVEELSEALHVKAPSAVPNKSASEPPSLTRVEAALAGGTFRALKAKDPAVAERGLKLLVLKLGAFSEKEFKTVAALVAKAGKDAIPALLEGMAHKVLAVRVGSNKVLRTVVGERQAATLAFDPWAPGTKRTTQLATVRRQLSAGY